MIILIMIIDEIYEFFFKNKKCFQEMPFNIFKFYYLKHMKYNIIFQFEINFL